MDVMIKHVHVLYSVYEVTKKNVLGGMSRARRLGSYEISLAGMPDDLQVMLFEFIEQADEQRRLEDGQDGD